MLKIILDTNVIVSALISGSAPTKILYQLVLQREFDLCLSDEIYTEYVEVLGRDKFKRIPNFSLNSDIVLNKIKEISHFYKPAERIEILRDASDNKFLELANICAANYLLTGNTRDFRISQFEHTQIISPTDFWRNLV